MKSALSNHTRQGKLRLIMDTGELNAQTEEILKGSFDLHVHAGPDPGRERRVDALDAARYAQEAEMAGFVLKSHEYSTAPLAYALNRMYPGLYVAGSICLNREVGGLNPDAVQAAGRLGARVVWMPTHSADGASTDNRTSLGLTDDGAKLVPQVHDILDIVHDSDMVLASGHVSVGEALALFRAAKDRGVRRMIATHPAYFATIDEQRDMMSLGVYLEYTFLSCMPSEGVTTPQELVNTIRSLGLDGCVLSTDFGQAVNPPPAEGFRNAIATLLHNGMSPDEVTKLVKENPRQLIGID